jgi:putative sigma-54 modulation protein
MKVSLTARHFELSDSLRDHVESRFSGLERYHQRASRVDVTLTQEKREKRVEVRAFVDGDYDIFAEAVADDFRTAVNRVSDKLTRQLKRRRDRMVDHQARRLNDEIQIEEEEEAAES